MQDHSGHTGDHPALRRDEATDAPPIELAIATRSGANGTFTFTGPFLTFEGLGTATLGGSLLNPEITIDAAESLGFLESDGDIHNTLGINANGLIDEERGFILRSGSINIPKGRLINGGYMDWKGGSFTGAELANARRLDISSGIPKNLDGLLLNMRQFRTNNPAHIYQNASLNLASPNPTDQLSGGRILNDGTHHLAPGALISGGGNFAYVNQGTLICEDGANAIVSSRFENRSGTVKVVDNSILHLTNCKDFISVNGTLGSGNWEVSEDSQLLFNEDVKRLQGARWEGDGALKVHSVIGEVSNLYRTNSVTHTQPLTVSERGKFGLAEDTTVTMPGCEANTGGFIYGSGTLDTDLYIKDATIAPGQSPGTLNVTGNTSFTSDSTYEWEASSPTESDLLNITTGTATLAGTVQPSFLDGYLPAPGTSITILTAPTISGTFDFVDHSALPPGLTATLAYTATSVTSVTLTVGNTTLPDYESWKITRFTPAEQADPLISGPFADPDNDGSNNLAEYSHGSNPKQANPSLVELVATTNATIDLRFPWSTFATTTFSTRTSTDLTRFSKSPHSILSQTASAPGLSEITLRINLPTSPRAFAQLLITAP